MLITASSQCSGYCQDSGSPPAECHVRRNYACASQIANPLPRPPLPATWQAAVRIAVSGTARGKNTTQVQRSQILGKIQALEALNPTSSPATSSLVSGNWALLYQGVCFLVNFTLDWLCTV